MQQEDPPLLAYAPPEPRRRIPLGRLVITAIAFTAAHFLTIAVALGVEVGDDPWGAKGWSATDRLIDVLSFPLVHLACHFAADPDDVGWGWVLLNSILWGVVLATTLGAALMLRRLLHNPPMHRTATAS
jgi:hypothetical protein